MTVSWRAILGAVTALALAGCAPEYSATEIESWVVDAQTGEPMPDVIVVAHWALKFGAEGGSQRDLELLETVTDKNGRFYFPAWGPKPFPKGVPWHARLENFDPEIILFKSGHGFTAVYNDRYGRPYAGAGPKVRKSLWHGKKIPFKRFPGDIRQYAEFVSGTLTGVSYGRCEWKKMPRMIAALDKEARRLDALGVNHWIVTIEDLGTSQADGECGPVKSFFGEYLK